MQETRWGGQAGANPKLRVTKINSGSNADGAGQEASDTSAGSVTHNTHTHTHQRTTTFVHRSNTHTHDHTKHSTAL